MKKLKKLRMYLVMAVICMVCMPIKIDAMTTSETSKNIIRDVTGFEQYDVKSSMFKDLHIKINPLEDVAKYYYYFSADGGNKWYGPYNIKGKTLNDGKLAFTIETYGLKNKIGGFTQGTALIKIGGVKIGYMSPEGGENLTAHEVALDINEYKVLNIQLTNKTSNSVTISWDSHHLASKYNVYSKDDTTGEEVYLGSTQQTTFTWNNIVPGKEYTLYVHPVVQASSGFELESSCELRLVGVYTAPSAVKNIELRKMIVQKKGYSIAFNWDKNDTADGYEVELSDSKGKVIKKYTTVSPFASGQQISEKKFKQGICRIRVRGYDYEHQYGDWSDYKIIQLQPRMTSFKVDNDRIGAKIKWTKVPGAKSYTIYRALIKESDIEDTIFVKKFKKVGKTKKTEFYDKKVNFKKNGSISFRGDYMWIYHQYAYFIVADGIKYNGQKLSTTIPQDGMKAGYQEVYTVSKIGKSEPRNTGKVKITVKINVKVR